MWTLVSGAFQTSGITKSNMLDLDRSPKEAVVMIESIWLLALTCIPMKARVRLKESISFTVGCSTLLKES